MTHTQADKNSGALRGGFFQVKAQQDNTKKDDVFTFAGGLITSSSRTRSLGDRSNYDFTIEAAYALTCHEWGFPPSGV
ncbi:hypothetical protein [Chamaesiphon sp.]|uniref:hypothetical protein n=1 Tax=Chamaesiphon sp. TaxID=2814140 RepID=UPI0035938D6B